MELRVAIQKYEWGKVGLESKVAQLYKTANPEFEIEESAPYAELWMGAHPNGPSLLKSNDELLSSLVQRHPEYLGEPIRQHFGDELPFLFKVLSVNKALSIQAHPSKEHAALLFAQRPDLYKDPNHKPEMAIALTPFEALCGFRPIEEIQSFMKNVRELRAIVGTQIAEQFIVAEPSSKAKLLLKDCFKNLMCASPDLVSGQLKQLVNKFSRLNEAERTDQLAWLIEKLYSQYPDDIGCFAAYFFNYVRLEPQQALYLGANEPHAYLSGDCVECMACSDNVVRAGLTPKFKDVDTLCEMLSYQSESSDAKLFKPITESKYCDVFRPPVKDFAVVRIIVPCGESYYRVTKRNSASIVLVVAGSALYNSNAIKNGAVFFVPANDVIVISDVTQDLLLFQAMANL